MHTTQKPAAAPLLPMQQRLPPQRMTHRDIETLVGLPDGGHISRIEAASLLGTSLSTLARWACEGRGPPVLQVGSSGFVRYEIGALRRWVAAHTARRAA
jgi:predicted DNA-binding transcriptional regulator AlpA